jgi:hypothetical protein
MNWFLGPPGLLRDERPGANDCRRVQPGRTGGEFRQSRPFRCSRERPVSVGFLLVESKGRCRARMAHETVCGVSKAAYPLFHLGRVHGRASQPACNQPAFPGCSERQRLYHSIPGVQWSSRLSKLARQSGAGASLSCGTRMNSPFIAPYSLLMLLMPLMPPACVSSADGLGCRALCSVAISPCPRGSRPPVQCPGTASPASHKG